MSKLETEEESCSIQDLHSQLVDLEEQIGILEEQIFLNYANQHTHSTSRLKPPGTLFQHIDTLIK
jgi:hypothetical protein